jgi:membrane protease YdiL (CAAX protease family)
MNYMPAPHNPLATVGPSAPSPRRAAGTLGACFAMMLVFLGACSMFQAPPAITWVSALNSLLAILAPTLVAFYWPRKNAPGALPYAPLSRWSMMGVACCSLPVYFILAAIQTGIAVHMRVHPSGTASQLVASSSVGFAAIWLAIAVLPALAEELLFRGMVQQAAVARLGALWGVIGSAAVFSFLHGEVVGFLPRLLMGLWFGYLFWRTGSLWASTLAHMLNNSWALSIANFPLGIEQHLTAVTLASLAALGLGLLAFRQAANGHHVPIVPNHRDVSTVPRVVPMQRPEAPRLEERPAGERAE